MMNTKDLIKIKRLELVSKKNAFGLLTGNYNTFFTGSGYIFKEARKYYEGDPVRWIDWNITAKFNEPYIRTFQDEREREVFLAIDISSSMFVGFQKKTKIEYAYELAATVAYSAVKNQDKLGFLFFSDKLDYFYKPKKSIKSYYHLLHKCVMNPKVYYSKESDIRIAIHHIQELKGKRFIIFIISDFIDYDIPEDLKYLKKWHDVNLFHIYDPVEHWDDEELRIWGGSPEGWKNHKWISTKQLISLKEKMDFLNELSYKYNIDIYSFSTISNITYSLLEFFYKKRLKVNL